MSYAKEAGGTQKDIYLASKALEEFPDLITVGKRFLCRKDVYYEDAENEVSSFITNKRIEENFPQSKINQAINTLKDLTRINEDEAFDFEKWVIPFKNGYYNIKNQIFREIPDKRFFYQIPHKFKGLENNCPKFKQALIDWLYNKKGDTSSNPCKENDIFEIIGYLMTMNTNLKKAFFIYGRSNSGKTTFQHILKHIIGKKNRCNISLSRMTKDQFGTDGMQLKILNMVGDHGSREISDIGIFKEMVGGDEDVAVEGKGKNKELFHNVAKFVFAGNRLPPIIDYNDEAYYRRWALVNFDNEFEDTRTPFSDSIIEDPSEIKGIISESIKGVIRLFNRGFFRKELTKNTEYYYKLNCNNIYRFVKEKCIIEIGSYTKVRSFRETYVRFVNKNKYGSIASNQEITNNLETFNIFKRNHQIKGITYKCWKNIRFLTEKEIEKEQKMPEYKQIQYDELLEEHEKELIKEVENTIPNGYINTDKEYIKRHPELFPPEPKNNG